MARDMSTIGPPPPTAAVGSIVGARAGFDRSSVLPYRADVKAVAPGLWTVGRRREEAI